MRLRRDLFLVAFAALLLPAAMAGQATSTVTGNVRNGTLPFSGATVHLDNTSIGLHRRVATDAYGEFRFEGVSPAAGYWITVNDQAGRVRAWEAKFDIGLTPPLHFTLPAINVAGRVTVTGRISIGGAPAAKLHVSLTNRDRTGREVYAPQPFTTNADGAYTFTGVKPDPGYSIVVRDSPTGKPVNRRIAIASTASASTPVQVPDVQLATVVPPSAPPSSNVANNHQPQVTPPTPIAPPPTPTGPPSENPPQTPSPGTEPPTPSNGNPGDNAPEHPLVTPPPPIAPGPSQPPSQPPQPVASSPAAPAASEGPTAPTVQNDFDPSMVAAISRQQLELLPLFNRNFLTLGELSPEVHDVTAGSSLQGAGFSISGSRITSTNFLLDGQDNVASNSNQAIPFQVNEAIQEFRIIYSNPGSEYGQSDGGVIDVVTNRGSSETHAWHGSLFGYFNDDSLNSNTPLSVYTGSTFFDAAAYAGPTDDTADEGGISACKGSTPCNLPCNPPAACTDPTLIYQSNAPTRYNALYSLLGNPNLAYLGGATGTTLYKDGPFDSAAVYSANDSHTQPFSSQQFGGRIGGPLFGSKLFLFGSYEGTRIDNPNPIFERVPSVNDLCASSTPAGINPSPTCAGGSADAAAAQNVLALFPTPNVTAATFAFYKGTAPNYTHVHNVLFRPDLSLGSKGSLSLRYTGQLLDQLHDDSLPAPTTSTGYPGNGADRRSQNQSLALVHTMTMGGGRVNVARLGFTQFRLDELAQDRNFNFGKAGVVPATYLLSGVDTQLTGAKSGTAGAMGGWYDSFWNQSTSNPAYSPSPIEPSLDGDFPFARIGAPIAAPSAHRDTEGEGSDLISFQLGSRNHFNAGADYRYQQNVDFEGGLARGIVVSNNIGEFTSDSETCISCGTKPSTLNPAPPQYAFQKPSFDYALRQPAGYVGDLRSNVIEGFLEDKFQASPRLTLTAGVRYEYFGQPTDQDNNLWNFDDTDKGLVRQGGTGTYDAFGYACGNTTRLDSIYGAKSISFNTWKNCLLNGTFSLPANTKDIAPRLGFAFAPDPDYHTVIRAAAGLYYDHLPASYTEQLLLNRPSPLSANDPSAIYGQNFFSDACGGYQCGLGNTTLDVIDAAAAKSQTNPSIFQAQYQAASGAGPIFQRDITNLKDPYAIQLSGGVQQQFSNNWAGEIAYVGSLGRHLPLIRDSNYTNEFYCSLDSACDNNTFFPIFTESNFGSSHYHSMVVRVRGEAWRGVTIHAAYTFGKSLDDIAGSQFPQANDSLWNQLFGRQLYGLGNPVAFALGANSIQPQSTSGGGGRGGDLVCPVGSPAGCTTSLVNALYSGATIPSINSFSSALTTTGSRQILTSDYSLPQDPINFRTDDRGRSDFDVTHRVVMDVVYTLPAFHSNRALSGFTVSGILVGQSGQPYTIFSGPAYGQITQRVDLGTTPIHTTGNPTQYFVDNGAFALPSKTVSPGCNLFAYPVLYTSPVPSQQACKGNSPRNAFTGPTYLSQDFSMQKSTRTFGESQSLVLRAEFYNLFNRSNYYNPITQYSADGVHENPEFGMIRSAHDPRQIQLAVRYDF